MRVLITGGAGFIGSHLSDYLLGAGHSVSVIDNFITGSRENVKHLSTNSRFTLIEGDVKSPSILDPLVSSTDYVIHLAAPVGVKFIMNNPVHTILDCVHSTETLLEAVYKHKKPVLMASTSEIYGKHLDILDVEGIHRLKEEDYRIEGSSRNHRWAYANVKSLTEFLTFAYIKQHNIKAVITRFFNTAGPRQRSDYGMVIPNFVQSALKGEDLMIYGTGHQRRSFIHIQDTVKAIEGIMERDSVFGEVFNVGNPDELSISELAERIIEQTGSRSGIQYVPYTIAYGDGFEEMDRRTADISKLHSYTGFTIGSDLNDILNDVISYERNRLKL